MVKKPVTVSLLSVSLLRAFVTRGDAVWRMELSSCLCAWVVYGRAFSRFSSVNFSARMVVS